MTPARGDLTAYRWAPFDETIAFEGVDFTNGTFAMEIRPYRDAPGTALLTLATGGGQGITVNPVTTNGLTTSNVRIRINEATIKNLLPFPASGVEPGQPVVLAYDLVVTTAALGKRRWVEGAFIIQPGVTQV